MIHFGKSCTKLLGSVSKFYKKHFVSSSNPFPFPYLHSSTCRGCFSHCLLHRGAWHTEQRCQVRVSDAAHARQMALDWSMLGPTTAAFSLRMMSPALRVLVATMYLEYRNSYLVDMNNMKLFDKFVSICDSNQLKY